MAAPGSLMSKQDPWYHQCRFRSVSNGPNKIAVAWIHERGAKVGRRMKFLDHRDPDIVWEVLEVWERARKSTVLERQQDYRHQRKASDI